MISYAPPANGNRVAAVYLARCAEGIDAFRRFANSYRAHAAGLPHSLVIIYKGYEQAAALNQARAVFADLPHIGIELDDTGFDIGAYSKATAQLDHQYVCFLNSFTEIIADGWLAALHCHASMPGVGIAGAMGSYESLYDSCALIAKVIWLCNEISIDRDDRFLHYYDFLIDAQCAAWKTNPHAKHRLARVPGARRALQLLFQRHWRQARGLAGPFAQVGRFPAFPNPHIRSNGFMIARERLLQMSFQPIVTKWDACAFESSRESLTARLHRQGLATVVVGRDGRGYDVVQWHRSGTFRLGEQSNLLLTDNQSRKFTQMSPGERATHVRMTWGDYLEAAPADFPDLGFKFAIDRSTIDPRSERDCNQRQFLVEGQELIEELQARHRETYANTLRLEALLETKNKQIAEIYDSFCWRCTRPIRIGGTWLRRLRSAVSTSGNRQPARQAA